MKIFNQECIKGMQKLPDKSIDLVVTSPPYFLEKEYEKNVTLNEFEQLITNMFEQLVRIVKGGGYIVVNFGDFFNRNRFYISDVPSVFPASYFYWKISKEHIPFLSLQAIRIWKKKMARMSIVQGIKSHPMYVFDYEYVWTFRKNISSGSKKYIFKQSEGKFVSNGRRKLAIKGVIGEDWKSKANQHTAAFPVELPTWAIKLYSFEGDTVLDPFMGSGTTGVACKMLNRQFIGFELNKEYFNIAKKRINDVKLLKTKIFDDNEYVNEWI